MRRKPHVLHLFADWKWTGPAEPTVDLCRCLRQRGYDLDFACARSPGHYPESIEHRARERHVEPMLDFRLTKGRNLVRHLLDVNRVAAFIEREEVRIVHVHSSHDHYIGGRAARKAGPDVRVVRTSHYGVPMPSTFRYQRLICGYTDGLIALSEEARQADARNFGIPIEKTARMEGCVNLEKFRPDATTTDMRPEFGLGPEHVVGGVVARFQRQRHCDTLLRAVARAVKEAPALRLLFVGRGTHIKEVAVRPAGEMGLGSTVIFTGYRRHDYTDVLAATDFLIYLVPGSDGSCRAVREAMAMGKPIVAARRGLLPELVEHGRCGLVVDDTPENLAAAIVRMASDADLRQRLGAEAARKAHHAFAIRKQCEVVQELYERVL